MIGMLKKVKLRGVEKVGWLLTFIRRRLQSLPIAKSPGAGGGLGDFHRVQFDKRVESGTICAYWSIAMDGAYDIFKKSSAKDAVWVETVQGFEQAKKRLLYYTSSSKDECLVFDATEGQFIDVLGKAASAYYPARLSSPRSFLASAAPSSDALLRTRNWSCAIDDGDNFPIQAIYHSQALGASHLFP